MGNPKAKTVKLLLEDGTLKGVMSIVDSNWNPGEMYAAPRESIDSLLSSDACNKFGVYHCFQRIRYMWVNHLI